MTTASRSNREKNVELNGTGKLGQTWKLSGESLLTTKSHMWRSYWVKTLARQHKQLPIFFGNILIKTGTETELILDCQRGTDGS